MSFLRHGESIDPMRFVPLGASLSDSLPVLIGLDEFQPAIPWQVALQQSLPPLRRPRAILQNQTSPYNDFSANGDNPLNSVSRPKGAVQDGNSCCPLFRGVLLDAPRSLSYSWSTKRTTRLGYYTSDEDSEPCLMQRSSIFRDSRQRAR
jgi:hypothetical protein